MISISEEKIRRCLDANIQPNQDYESPYPPGVVTGKARQAAVLIPFIPMQDDWHILFIRRTHNPDDRHSGQVAFPGGALEPGDDGVLDAALREAHEEIGVYPEDVEILGRMRDMLTITNYMVTPIVGKIPWPYELELQKSEVSRAFSIPLGWLADERNRTIETRELESGDVSIPVIYFNEFQGETLWGASARITVQLLEALELI